MNTAPATVPPPARRRSLQLPTEPLLFAVMLTLLTLGINVGPPKAEAAKAANALIPSKSSAAR